jgi:hypothetical protein
MPIGFSKIAIMSLRISKRNRILKTHETDCVSIADIYTSAKVWISYSEYTISKYTIHGEMGTIGEYRYKSGIPKNRKVFDW